MFFIARWAYHAKISSWYMYPAKLFIPKHSTTYYDEILLNISRVWYSFLAWFTLCAETRQL